MHDWMSIMGEAICWLLPVMQSSSPVASRQEAAEEMTRVQEVLKHIRSRWFKVVNDVLTPALRDAPPQPVQAVIDGSALAGLPRVPSMSSLLRVSVPHAEAIRQMSWVLYTSVQPFVHETEYRTVIQVKMCTLVFMHVMKQGAAGVQEAAQQVRVPIVESTDADTAGPAAAEASLLPVDPRRAGTTGAAAAPAPDFLPQDPRAAAAPPGAAPQLPRGMGHGLGPARLSAGASLQGGAAGQPVPPGAAQSKTHRVRPPVHVLRPLCYLLEHKSSEVS